MFTLKVYAFEFHMLSPLLGKTFTLWQQQMLVSQLLLVHREHSHSVTEIAVIAFLYHLFFHLDYVRFWPVIFPEAVSVSAR